MSTTIDVPDCPHCDEPMHHHTVSEHNTPTTEDHDGYRCPTCNLKATRCSHCDGLHHPDNLCRPKRIARIEQARERTGGRAKIPGHGTVPITDCEIVGEATPIYTVANACPDCNGDLVYTLEHNPNADLPSHAEAEFQPAAEHCTNANGPHPTCTYSKP